MPVLTAKILLQPTRRAWTQIYETDGLVALLALEAAGEGEEVKPAVEIGHEALNLLQSEYLASNKDPQKLSDVVERVGSAFDKYSVMIAVCQFSGEQVYFVRRGVAEIWAIRNQKPYRLNSDNFSGRYDAHDMFLLGTTEFFNAVAQEHLEDEFVGKSTVDQIVDHLSPVIHRLDNPKAGAVVIKPTVVVKLAATQPTLSTYYAPAPPVGAKKVNFIRSLLVRFARILPEREFQVNIAGRSPRATALSVGVVLLALLIVSIFLGVRQKGKSDYRASYQDRLSRAQVLYGDAVSEKGTNLLAARDSFTQSKSIVEALVGEGIKDAQLDQLKANLDANESDILGQSHVPAVLFLDLSIFRPDSTASSLSFDSKTIAALDTKGERVIFIGSSNKETGVSGKVSVPVSVSIFDRKTYVLGKDGVSQADKSGAKAVIPFDSEWVGPITVSIFGSNIYLLQKDGSVWKYPATATGFGPKQKWMSDATSVLGGAADWAIDGSVYVLSESGEIAKFTRGLKDGFRVSGLSKAFNAPASIYTDTELDSLYILDKGNSRIVELDKSGNYKFEYDVDEAKSADDLVVSGKDKKIFLLANNKIFAVPLK